MSAARIADSAGGPPLDRWTLVLCVGLLAVGVVSRLAPLADQDGRLLRQFLTEDGYLMLTIARNLGLGLGMSTAAGTIPTNGTQPLVTLLWSGLYALLDGDRVWGAAAVQLAEAAFAGAAAWMLWRLGRDLLGPTGQATAALAAAAWFAGPLAVDHTQNGLETAACALGVLAVARFLLRSPDAEDGRWRALSCLALGALLGVVFWVRNDTALLVTAACAVWVGPALLRGGREFAARLREAFLFGGTALTIALPWLIWNQLRFGSIVPISGIAEAQGAHLGGNVAEMAIALAEYVAVVAPIPKPLESHPVILAGASLLDVAALVVLFLALRASPPVARRALGVLSLYAFALCGFYGLSFGAGYFMSRYLFPLSPLLALLSAVVVATALRRLPARRPLALAGAALVLAIVVGLNVRLYALGSHHAHFQVVEWVSQNVAPETWVAGNQTGTVGYFHDRTLNLDGKVNPEALRARRERRIPEYVVGTDVQYLVGWLGLAHWERYSLIRDNFELIVLDRARNMAAWKRRPAH